MSVGTMSRGVRHIRAPRRAVVTRGKIIKAAKARRPSVIAAKAQARADFRARTSAILAALKDAVADEVGRAIAAVLHDRPPESFTPEEAAAAIVDPVVLHDHPKSHRAQRAGILAGVTRLRAVIPPLITDLIEAVLTAMDNSEIVGWATPDPNGRSHPGWRAYFVQWFAYEVYYQRGRRACSRTVAIGIVAGVWPEGKKPTNAAPPILRWDKSYEALKKILQQGEAAFDPKELAYVRAAGAAERRGEKPDPAVTLKRTEAIAAWPFTGPKRGKQQQS